MKISRGNGNIDALRSAPILAVDTETVNTNDLTMIGIGVFYNDTDGIYFSVFPEQDDFIPELMWMLSDRDRTKVYHNGISFDLEVLDRFAQEEGFSPPDDVNFQDSEIMAKVSGLPGGLQRIGEEWLGATDLFSIKDLFEESGTRNMLDVPVERVAEKCLNDCRTTWQLYQNRERVLSDRQRYCYEIDRRLIPVLRNLQTKGLGLRQGVLEEHQDRLQRDILRIRRECEYEGIENPGSNVQVGFVLASRGCKLPFTKGARRQLRVNEEVLEELDDPLAKVILEYRGKSKLLSTYVIPWLGKDRAYTHFRLDLATGRLASGAINAWDKVNRNLQNIPPVMREVFRPDNSIWSWADHGQIELRTLAYMSRDERMVDEYKKAEPDLHSITAKAGGVDRSAGKTFNFAMVYGASNKMLARRTGVRLERIQGMREAWRELYPGAQSWINRQFFNHNGEWVEDDFGRRMRLPEPVEGAEVNMKAFQAHVGKCAVNYPIQGTAATIVKMGMLMIYEAGWDMKLQLHDEYLIDGSWEPDPKLAYIHPELYTPFELKKGIIWS